MATLSRSDLGLGTHVGEGRGQLPRGAFGRLSREEIKSVLRGEMAKQPERIWTLAELCHTVGKKPSTHMRQIMAEMCFWGDVKSYVDEGDYHVCKRHLYALFTGGE